MSISLICLLELMEQVKLEERKLKEIEHSRKRREVLQGFERIADTHAAAQVAPGGAGAAFRPRRPGDVAGQPDLPGRRDVRGFGLDHALMLDKSKS